MYKLKINKTKYILSILKYYLDPIVEPNFRDENGHLNNI